MVTQASTTKDVFSYGAVLVVNVARGITNYRSLVEVIEVYYDFQTNLQ